MNQYGTREQREKQFIKKLSQKNNQLTYIGGYIHSDKSVLLECNICGYRFKRNANGIRGKKNYTCPNCQEKEKSIEKEIEKLLKEQKRYIIQTQAKKNNDIKKIQSKLKKKTIYIKQCKYCNKTIYTQRNYKQICDGCSRKHKFRNHSNKSLKKLYSRDKGICYICGGKCDYEDYIYKGNTFIAGNYYPSIDHVIPLIKGGTDDWNNLKLAHRICNSLKRDIVVD